MRRLLRALLPAFLLCAARLGADPIPVKVAVVVTFEAGADRGDRPGEFQFWVERENWTQKIDVPGVDHPVLTDGNGTIGVVSGTTVRSSNQIMALALSGVFDFSRTYWVVNGIAGVNPAVASIGSAAWAHYVIDGDVAYEIDAREADASWPYAIVPIGSKTPNQKPTHEKGEPETMAYPLDPALVGWANVREVGARHDGLSPGSCAGRMGLCPHKGRSDPGLRPDEGLPGVLRGVPERAKAPVRPLRGDVRLVPLLARKGDDAMGERLDPAMDEREGRVCHVRHGGPGNSRRAEPSVEDGKGRFPAGPFSQDGEQLLHAGAEAGREQQPAFRIRRLHPLARGRVPRGEPRDPRARRALGRIPRPRPGLELTHRRDGRRRDPERHASGDPEEAHVPHRRRAARVSAHLQARAGHTCHLRAAARVHRGDSARGRRRQTDPLGHGDL